MNRGLGIVGLFAAAGALALLAWPKSPGRDPIELTEPAADRGDSSESAKPPPELAGAPVTRPKAKDRAPAPTPPNESAPATAGARIVGRILDADGKPIVGARVALANGRLTDPGATTDAEGRFELDGAPGESSVAVSMPGFTIVIVPIASLAAGARITLEKAWMISGTVREQGTDVPIGAVTVRAAPASSPESGHRSQAMWREDGSFAITVPAAGIYVLDVGDGYLDRAPGAADDYIPTRVEHVAAGSSDVQVRLERGRAIEGEIVDDAGQRVARKVSIDAVGRTPEGDADYTRRRVVRTADGTLKVPGLRPGRYDLWIRPDSDAADTSGAAVSATVVHDIAAGTTGLVVHLVRGYLLVGRLEDADGTAVITKGAVYAYPAGEMAKSHPVFAEVPGDGTFRVGPLDDGLRYDLLAAGFAGYREARIAGVAPRDARGVVLVLPKGTKISGRIQTVEGKPVPAGVPIGVIMEGAARIAPGMRVFAYSTADSTFVADGLAEGPFTIQAGGGKSGYLGDILKGVRGGAADVVLRVAEGVELSGTLVDAEGEPVATTSLQADDGARLAAMRPYAQVGADGKFLFRGLRPGKVRLSARIGDASVSAGEVDAPGVSVTATLAPK